MSTVSSKPSKTRKIKATTQGSKKEITPSRKGFFSRLHLHFNKMMNSYYSIFIQAYTKKRGVRISTWGVGILVFFAGIFLCSAPFLPALQYTLNPPSGDLPYAVSQPELFGLPAGDAETKPIPEENRIVIPTIGVDAEIIEGRSLDVLNTHKGVWRDPNTADPLRPGNMVLSGHRFQYLPPNTTTLYTMDKVSVGDKLIVYWEGKDYVYEVNRIFEVFPDEVSIKQPSASGVSEMTLYTCTPIGSTAKRLVIKATLISASVPIPIEEGNAKRRGE